MTRSKANKGKKNIKIDAGQYVLIVYSDDFRTFYITDVYQTQDVEILKQQGFIENITNKSNDDNIVFISFISSNFLRRDIIIITKQCR